MLYVQDLLSPSEFKEVLAEYESLKDHLDDEGPSLAIKRMVVPAPADGAIVAALAKPELAERLQSLTGLKSTPKLWELPVEYRRYEVGSSMVWHTDKLLDDLERPQLELVLTLLNTSDSRTRWTTDYVQVSRGRYSEVWTTPNSALLLRANGAVHMVTEVTKGSRVIAKAVFTSD